MIIQCEQCRTKFKLDDSKVPDKGVKVRCAKCKSVFSVARELPAMAAASDFESMLESSAAAAPETAEYQNEYTAPEDSSALEFTDEIPGTESPGEDEPQDDGISFETGEEAEPDFAPAADDQLDFQTTDLPQEDDLFPPVPAPEPEPEGDLDFGSFAFNEEDDAAEVAPSTQTLDFGDAPKALPPSEEDDFGGLDFSDDDMFGAVATAPAEETDDGAGFDFGMDDFASSMGVEDAPATQKNAFAMADSATDSPFSLDEIDFGDDLTSVGVQHVNPEELKPSQELLFAPLAEAQSKPLSAPESSFAPKSPSQDELPPLPIASRRKQSPFMSAVFAICGIIIAAALGIYGYSMFAGSKGDGLEAGQIAINNVEASFVKNKQTGDLIVISGEAVNNYRKPRAAIKVRGLVYDANGDEITSKAAFCGNPLTNEQLATMSLEQIEAAMANQFGDSLANMEVPPGKAIPFVIVIAKPATGAKDYGVEPAGSTVASVKQQ